MNTSKENYELKMSKTGHPIPVVNGIHLHSIYNPVKEAEGVIEKYSEAIEKKHEYLVLGLGLGYHLKELVRRAKTHHGDNYKVLVIEPNARCFEDYKSHLDFDDSNVSYFISKTPNDIYSTKDVVSFLVRKPAVISHAASFNLHNLYFKDVLSYKAPKKVSEQFHLITNEDIRDLLQNLDPEKSLDDNLNILSSKNLIQSPEEFLLLAYKNIERNQQRSF